MDEPSARSSVRADVVWVLIALAVVAVPVTFAGAETIKWSAAFGQVRNPTYTGARAYVAVLATYILVVSLAIAAFAAARARRRPPLPK